MTPLIVCRCKRYICAGKKTVFYWSPIQFGWIVISPMFPKVKRYSEPHWRRFALSARCRWGIIGSTSSKSPGGVGWKLFHPTNGWNMMEWYLWHVQEKLYSVELFFFCDPFNLSMALLLYVTFGGEVLPISVLGCKFVIKHATWTKCLPNYIAQSSYSLSNLVCYVLVVLCHTRKNSIRPKTIQNAYPCP